MTDVEGPNADDALALDGKRILYVWEWKMAMNQFAVLLRRWLHPTPRTETDTPQTQKLGHTQRGGYSIRRSEWLRYRRQQETAGISKIQTTSLAQ